MRKITAKTPFWEVKAASEKVGEVFIYGDIVSEKWFESDVTAKGFQEDLEALGDIDTLNVYINSYGGSVFQAQAIYTILKRHPASVNVYIDGLAASAASLVAVAGDTVYIPENAMMMVHWPWSLAIGNASDLRREADALDKIGESMVAAYLAKTGDALTGETLAELLDAETWMTAQEAVEYGFADELVEAKEIAASGDPEWLKRYKNVPENVLEMAQKGDKPQEDSDLRAKIAAECEEMTSRVKQILGGI